MTDLFLANTKPIGFDADVDKAIAGCLSVNSPRSFVTFAGAGSGKTYSLQIALEFLKDKYENEFLATGRQVAVVTFTNNAAEEISTRVDRSAIFDISTIHSFCWRCIDGFNQDIRQWYLTTIPDEISLLTEKEKRGRTGAASDARRRITRLKEKLIWLSEPQTFVYDANGVNSELNALSHTEVLSIFAYLVINKPLMQGILADKYRFFFVDESQDTDKAVINALFELQRGQKDRITIGLFGDTMQRIFDGGDANLGVSVPGGDWEYFYKKMNHRSARRIVGLGNTIRLKIDNKIQFAREGAADGVVRFFVLSDITTDKISAEQDIRTQMADITGDDGWMIANADDTAVLLLEHKMISRRLGFERLASVLTKSKEVGDRMFEGKNSELNFFANTVLPIIESSETNDEFLVMSLLRENDSPLLEEDNLTRHEGDPLLIARQAEQALRVVYNQPTATLGDILNVIVEHNLLSVPAKLRIFMETPLSEEKKPIDIGYTDESLEQIVKKAVQDDYDVWLEALSVPFDQIRGYRNYVNQEAIYRTHQGVKGNEFERVMVIESDQEAGGFFLHMSSFWAQKSPQLGR